MQARTGASERPESGGIGALPIARIETYHTPDVAVVKVLTEDGSEGIGQTAPKQAAVTARVLHELVAPMVLGQSAWDVRELARQVVRKQYKFTGTFLFRALCGVDTALWDLLGKATGQPVYRLLNGKTRSEIPMYASSMRRDISPDAEAERMLALIERHGFGGVKVRLGSRMGQDRDAAPGRTERLIVTMREALGDDIEINADANGGFSPHRAIAVGRLLEAHGYHHFEEPCPFQEYENTAMVAAALDIPIAGGEQDTALERFNRMIADRVVDIVQPDVGYIGGITRARQVAEMAEIAGVPCTPHCANRSLLQVFTLHLAAASPACYQRQEWRIEADQDWSERIYEPALDVRAGVLHVPERPGWGVEILPSFYHEAEATISTLAAS